MKTLSKTPIVGFPIPPEDRNSSRSWRSGSGTCVWNSASISLRRWCAPSNLPLLRIFYLSPPTSQPLKVRQFQLPSMVLPSGPNLRLLEAFPARLLRCNPMARCAVPLTVRFTRKNADRSVTAPCVSCMLGGLAIAALVGCGNSVKKAPRPKNRDGSVLCFGPSHLILARLSLRHPCYPLLFCALTLPCCGRIGLVVICADTGSNSSAAKRLSCPGSLPACLSLLLRTAKPC